MISDHEQGECGMGVCVYVCVCVCVCVCACACVEMVGLLAAKNAALSSPKVVLSGDPAKLNIQKTVERSWEIYMVSDTFRP